MKFFSIFSILLVLYSVRGIRHSLRQENDIIHFDKIIKDINLSELSDKLNIENESFNLEVRKISKYEFLQRPFHTKYAKFARWIVDNGFWGSIATTGKAYNVKFEQPDRVFKGPFANIVAFANIHGVPYFYLSELDPTAADAALDPTASFVISEASFGSCKLVSAEEPICSKLTLNVFFLFLF